MLPRQLLHSDPVGSEQTLHDERYLLAGSSI